MNYLRCSARISRLEGRTKDDVRARMDAGETVVERIDRIGFERYGHISNVN